MLIWPAAMVDENRVRLRASCNSCNESKVRCSQQKPTCARCEHNNTKCIYGLSRRTHKGAPPISVPSSQRGRGPSRPGAPSSRPGRPSRLPSSDDTRSSASTSSDSISKTATRSYSALLDEPAEAHNMFPTTTETEAARLDLSNLLTGSTGGMSMAPGYFSTTGAEYADSSTPWHREFLFGANHNSDAVGMGGSQALDGEGGCTCHTGATELLASMRGDSGGGGGSNHQRPAMSLDAQLAKLNQSIVACEASMGCAHGCEDTEPIYIMAVAMLISYVIDGFKMLASESSPAPAGEMVTLGNGERESRSGVATPSSINMSLGGLMEPRLSWGAVELDDNDERDLRQRLYLLSFRKLERVLSRLTLHIQDLHIALASLPDPSRHLAFVIACDYTRLWLEKKVGDVKRMIPE
ncbi:hypothetical protein DL767_007127 [Monosporascus sp. MG133]|nr:hypothetical protein DL767_007127 [Monosporascus sp. MG133]